MIGIYKITSPSGKVYIGQSINIQGRWKRNYQKLKCKSQPKLYNSLVKYGFSEHIFEVVEECGENQLNVRERHWQDFYNVLGENGLNCKLTGTEDLKVIHSEDVRKKISTALSTLYSSSEGRELLDRRTAKTDYVARTAKTDYEAFREKRIANTDMVAAAAKRVANIDFAARTAKFDYAAKVSNTDYGTIAKKLMKPTFQYSKEGALIKEWSSVKEAGEVLKIQKTNISSCCRGLMKSAGGFIWKYE